MVIQLEFSSCLLCFVRRVCLSSPSNPLSSKVPAVHAVSCRYFHGQGAASHTICEEHRSIIWQLKCPAGFFFVCLSGYQTLFEIKHVYKPFPSNISIFNLLFLLRSRWAALSPDSPAPTIITSQISAVIVKLKWRWLLSLSRCRVCRCAEQKPESPFPLLRINQVILLGCFHNGALWNCEALCLWPTWQRVLWMECGNQGRHKAFHLGDSGRFLLVKINS